MKLHHYTLLACLAIPANKLSGHFPEIFKDTIKNWSLIYAGAMGGLIAHELGHALTAKVLWGNHVDITIGAQPDKDDKEKKAPWFKFLGVQFQSLNPLDGGFTWITDPSKADNATNRSLYERIAVLAAGPCAGIAFLALACKAFHIQPTHDSQGDFLGFSFNGLILHQIYNLFFTANQLTGRSDGALKSDGENIYDALCILKERRNQRALSQLS